MPIDEAERAKLEFEHNSKMALLSHQATLDYARDALKSIIIINGAAAAALLALISQVVKDKPAIIPALTPALSYFAVGVLMGGAASATSYFSQLCYSHAMGTKKVLGRVIPGLEVAGFASHALSLLCALVGFATFAGGVWSAAGSLHQFDWNAKSPSATSIPLPTPKK